jgi:hypothetical protein
MHTFFSHKHYLFVAKEKTAIKGKVLPKKKRKRNKLGVKKSNTK